MVQFTNELKKTKNSFKTNKTIFYGKYLYFFCRNKFVLK